MHTQSELNKLKKAVEIKRVEVNKHYATCGFESHQYQNSFDELHDLNIIYMAAQFRHERGMPKHFKTPYCEQA